ncbi:MAG TPA: LytTR family DNA-binding domain-containing protein [Puia sp.]|jgi:two-component system response regulator LytT|nr:LytTR family DNA-binding domain-containing protein [Puia sp.]
MKIVIIEDEPLMAKDLERCIVAAEPTARVVARLSSVGEAIAFLREHEPPDLLFSDIQLGDGDCFSIFEAYEQTIPVIFCTAYDEYALKAFRAAGIDYILKPFTGKDIAAALAKYKTFTGAAPSYRELSLSFGERKLGSVLVFHKEKIVPVDCGDIAFFYVQNEITRLVTFGKQQFIVGKPLEELERTVAGRYYRVNRQFLVNRRAIKDVSHYFGRKLLVNLSIPFDEKVTVGRVKANQFLEWLAGS